jgi:hypothetical protein
MGRKQLLTREIIASVSTAARLGVTNSRLHEHARVSRSAFMGWLAQGRDAKSGLYRDLYEAVYQGRAEAEKRALAVIAKAGGAGQWTASAWLLERSFGYHKTERLTDEKPEAESIEDINNQFLNGDLDFTEWREADLDSSVYDIVRLNNV